MAKPKTPEVKRIGDDEYTITIHPGSEGMEVAAELATMFGPSLLGLQSIQQGPVKKFGKDGLAKMVKRRQDIQEQLKDATGDDAAALKAELDKIDSEFEPDEGALLGLLGDLLKQLKPKPLVALLKTLFKYTLANGAKLGDDRVFDDHFAGNYGPTIELAQAVVKYNGFLEIAAGYL